MLTLFNLHSVYYIIYSLYICTTILIYFIMVNNNIIQADSIKISYVKRRFNSEFFEVEFLYSDFNPFLLIINDRVYLKSSDLPCNQIYMNTDLSFGDFIKRYPILSNKETFYYVEF